METPDEIWQGDLLGRRSEAEDLIGYLESVSARPQIRDEGHAHVLAVDSSYGQGKSYFLRRLARHMAADHAVAFVDAWVDDLEDQPMVALAATLDSALEPWVQKHPELSDPMAQFRAKAGKVAKIVGVGLAKRAASFVIMASGAEALGDELSKANDVLKDVGKDTIKDASNDIVDSVATGFGGRMASSMEQRINRFRDGQKAILDMKQGLAEIVQTLLDVGMKMPITIVIDELDRCRPTYAIKVLEELKHLFDVPGVAFVLGMHGEQLSHSIGAAYGTGFDSSAYLRRFLNRRYTLRDAALTPLVEKLCIDLAIPTDRLLSPSIAKSENTRAAAVESSTKLIAEYIKAYGLSARDAFPIIEMLQTTMALSGGGDIILPLIMPMIISHIKNLKSDDMKITRSPDWVYVFHDHSGTNLSINEYSMDEAYKQFFSASRMSIGQLRAMINNGSASDLTEMVFDIRQNSPKNMPSNDPARYDDLLQRVARFKSA